MWLSSPSSSEEGSLSLHPLSKLPSITRISMHIHPRAHTWNTRMEYIFLTGLEDSNVTPVIVCKCYKPKLN